MKQFTDLCLSIIGNVSILFTVLSYSGQFFLFGTENWEDTTVFHEFETASWIPVPME